MNLPLSRRAAIARMGGGLGTLGLLASLPGAASALPNAASPMRA
jgi:hypothetical protein